MKVSVSILSLEQNIRKEVNKLAQTSADYMHLDIMDKEFVKNRSWNYKEIKLLLKGVKKPYDVHLMVCDLKSYIDDFKKLKPEFITFHLEAIDDIDFYINYIKKLKIKVGLSIKPDTDITKLLPYLDKIDLVLVMSVHPGFGGQKFIDESIFKVEYLTQVRMDNDYNFMISVDGGVDDVTVRRVAEADMVVSGSYITSSDNYEEAIESLRLKNN